MLLKRKYLNLPIIAIFVFVGLIAFHSPVHAEDTPPVTDTVVETVPETPPDSPSGSDSGQTDQTQTEGTSSTGDVAAPVSTQDAPVEDTAPTEVAMPPEAPASTEATATPEPPASTDVAATSESTPEATPVADENSALVIKTDSTGNSLTDKQAQAGVYETTEKDLLVPVVTEPVAVPNVVVFDQDGNVLPLGSQEAGDVLAVADPYFYVGATKYSFTTTNCGPDINAPCSYPLQAAFDYIATHNLSPVGGAVYAEAGTYSSLVINGNNWGNKLLIPASLSLIGVTAVDKQVGTSTDHIISGTLIVSSIKSFTLQAFSIIGSTSSADDAVAWFGSNTGTLNLTDVDIQNTGSGSGLYVTQHTGAVNLNMVDSSGNTLDGAYIDNKCKYVWNGTDYVCSDLVANPITIKNSSFNNNGRSSFLLLSNGAATLTGVSASNNGNNDYSYVETMGLTINQSIFNDNGGDGFYVIPHPKGGAVTVQNSQFNGNTWYGLFIQQNGNVDIKNVRASDNGNSGLWIDTCSAAVCSNIFTGNVTVAQSTFTGNVKTASSATGLYGGVVIQAKGIVTLTDVYSGQNGDGTHPADGVYLNNLHGTTAFAANITSSSFSSNSRSGLEVYSKGIITAKDISSDYNSNDGVYLDNRSTLLPGVNVFNSTGVVNLFNNNGSDGLVIYSNGTVVVNAPKADSNNETGIYVNNADGTGTVTIDGVSGTTASKNHEDGIWVISKGAITVKNIDALENSKYGYQLNNSTGTAASGVTVTTTLPRWHNGLDNNGLDGLYILSKGAVIVQKTSASGNSHFGAYIDNTSGTGTVTISDSYFDNNAKASVSPDPSEYGLLVKSKGAITVTNISANNNGNNDLVNDANDVEGNGALLDNSTASTPSAISITKGNFNRNFGNGLDVFSVGAITYTTGNITENALSSATLDNHLSALNQLVTLTTININGSGRKGLTGLTVLSKGNITITATDVGSFLGDGTVLNNSYGTGTVSVTGISTWTRYFGNNGGAGLTIVTNGAVTLNYLAINDNVSYGAQIDDGGTLSTITISNTSFQNNTGYGLNVDAYGAITLDGVQITDNKSYGASLDNVDGTGTVTVRSTNGNSISWNTGGYGLYVHSKGAITLTNIAADNNGSYGATLDNSLGTGGVTITGISTNWQYFGRNSGFGLSINTTGAISMSYLSVNDNVFFGAQIIDTGALSTVTLSNVSFRNNGDYGVDIDAKGAISLDGSDIKDNKNFGANLDNVDGTGTVTVKSTNGNEINNNVGFGLNVVSKGAITLTNMQVYSNSDFGAKLDNHLGTGGVTVSGTSTWWRYFGNNGEEGLTINTTGAVTLSYLQVNDNTLHGVDIISSGPTGIISLSYMDIKNNTTYGLSVDAKGNISLVNVQIENNRSYGATLDNVDGTGTVSVTSTTGKRIGSNAGHGLWVISKGGITVTNIEVNWNAGWGAWLDNSLGTAAPVTMANTMYRNFQSNSGFGLEIDSSGIVLVNLVDVSSNSGSNGYIDNRYGANTAIPTVTVTNSWFSGSGSGSGLDVLSKGNISLTNVSADGNWLHGLILNNAGTYGKGTVTLSGTSSEFKTFNSNGDFGLQILSNGAVTMSYIESTGNLNYGGSIDNSTAALPQTVTLTSTTFNGNSGSIAGFGLRVLSKGNITGYEVFAHGNGNGTTSITGNGLQIDNCILSSGLCTGSGTVSLTSSGAWSNNGYGMDIMSYGTMTMSDVSAGNNASSGATFANNFSKLNANPLLANVPSVAGVTISLPVGYSSSWGTFEKNNGYGLKITSNGAVSVSGVNVNGNTSSDYGAFIDNTSAATPMAVTITNSKFNNNTNAIRGIWVLSKGAITFSNNEVRNNLGANADDQGAAELDNSTSTLPQNVTVTYSSFVNNGNTVLGTGYGDGLLVLTKGNALFTNVNASGNKHVGLEVSALYGPATGTITINGTQNTFSGNGRHGVSLATNGNVSVTNITSEYNSGQGLLINPQGIGTGIGTVTVTNANVNRNGANGMMAWSNGLMTLTNVTAVGNGKGSNNSGAVLVTNSKDITITNSTFSGNEGSGIISDTGAGKTLKLIGTSFFGNDINKSGDANLTYTGLVAVS